MPSWMPMKEFKKHWGRKVNHVLNGWKTSYVYGLLGMTLLKCSYDSKRSSYLM
jgi:hypothetical protein